LDLSYILAKKKAKQQLMLEIGKSIFNGQRMMANTSLWCEFCMQGKKRWEIKLVGVENVSKIKDEFLKGVFEKPENDFIFACESCIEKLTMQPLKNEQGGTWDGHGEALREVMEMRNPNAK
jgi:hypothetical protein